MTNQISDAMEEVLMLHQRQSSDRCLCGWAELGRSHPAHQAATLSAAGFGLAGQGINTNQLTIHFTNGEGTLYRLDADLPGGAVLNIPTRDVALAKALLDIALANLRRAERSEPVETMGATR